jgi:hypothetical protein
MAPDTRRGGARVITKQTLFNELQALGIEYDPNATGHAADTDTLSKIEQSHFEKLHSYKHFQWITNLQKIQKTITFRKWKQQNFGQG